MVRTSQWGVWLRGVFKEALAKKDSKSFQSLPLCSHMDYPLRKATTVRNESGPKTAPWSTPWASIREKHLSVLFVIFFEWSVINIAFQKQVIIEKTSLSDF